VNEYGVREIEFLDDNISVSKVRMESICDEIIKRKIDIKWATPNGIAYWTLDEELLRKMKKSGCYRLTFGIESGNIETRKFIGKIQSLEKAKQIIQYANKIGLWTICTFIIGFPCEQEDSIMDTIKYAVESGTDYAVFFLLGVFPGTRVYEIFKKEGLFNYDDVFENLENATIDDFSILGQTLASRGTQTIYFTQKELQAYLDEAYKFFARNRIINYLNPVRILRKIKSLEDLLYTIKLGRAMTAPLYKMAFKKFKTHFVLRNKNM
jgi:magnesium-protoporphyrin IX monomethyl ester (oxidative) cyclase